MERITIRVKQNIMTKIRTEAHIASKSLQEVFNEALEKGLNISHSQDDVFDDILKIRAKTTKGETTSIIVESKKDRK